ncbi:nuclear transport factor 2 family protein [Streptomyces sp. NPDC001443]
MQSYSETVARLVARQEIVDVLHRYCRGLDRMDRKLADTVWHPNGTADYGPDYRGPGSSFLDFVWTYHAQLDRHSHLVSNTTVEFGDGLETAASETYVSVWLRTRPVDGQVTELFHRGRYVDQWSCRDGVWAIDHRAYIGDLYREETHPAATGVDFHSERDATDLSYGVFR